MEGRRPTTSRDVRRGRADRTAPAAGTPSPPRASRSTVISSQARPGSRISARSRSSRGGRTSSTRQKSRLSPTLSRAASRRPRRSPTPPTRVSIQPRSAQASGIEYHPFSPPIPSTTRQTSSGEALHRACAGGPGRGCRPPSRGRWAADRRPLRAGGGGPAGGHLRVADPAQGQLQRPVHAERPARRVRHIADDVPFGAHHFMAQRLHQRAGDGAGYGRDQADPETGQPGGEHRHRDDQTPPADPGHLRVPPHHVRVGEDVGAADVEGPVHVVRQRGAAHQQSQHIADGDRLSAGVRPAGRASPSPAAAR
ncbi:hypothetical protein SANTM175S_08802 [Streptomyces antimycoticus]